MPFEKIDASGSSLPTSSRCSGRPSRSVLEAEPDLDVVGEARDGLQAVAEAERSQPDVVFLDAALPNCDGIRATGLIRERVPTVAC